MDGLGEAQSPTRWRRAGKTAALGILVVAIVVVPFAIFGNRTEDFVRDILTTATSRHAAAWASLALLAADIVLPVPSTIVISLLGGFLGWLPATLVAAIGLTLGCIVGCWLGRLLGRDFAERAMGREDFAYLAERLDRHGALLLALCRPVPVLAEASVIAAGVGKVLAVTTLANIGFAAVYAMLGASADSGGGFFIAVGASIVLPLAAMATARAWKSRVPTL